MGELCFQASHGKMLVIPYLKEQLNVVGPACHPSYLGGRARRTKLALGTDSWRHWKIIKAKRPRGGVWLKWWAVAYFRRPWIQTLVTPNKQKTHFPSEMTKPRYYNNRKGTKSPWMRPLVWTAHCCWILQMGCPGSDRELCLVSKRKKLVNHPWDTEQFGDLGLLVLCSGMFLRPTVQKGNTAHPAESSTAL
jgi:hypothetical protein